MVIAVPKWLFLLALHGLVASAAYVVVPKQHSISFSKSPRSFSTPSQYFSFSSSSTARLLSPPTYEALVEKLPPKSVIEAVETYPDRKVVAADVAASAGVSLSQARRDLTTLASISRGDIAVSQDGELIYEFPPNLNSVLSSNSFKYKAQDALRKVWPGLFYVLRVSFGVALLASIAAIYSTIFFLSQSSSSDDDRRRDDRGGGGMRFGGGPSFSIWGPSPFDFLYYRPYYGYYAAPGRPARDPDEMGFLESVFSYVFGDGNPNEGLEERRLSLAAEMIRSNNNAVTAEQLAPFCDEAPPPNMNDESSYYIDESFVLPIVSQLNGEPRVTDDGDIVYVFPELQVTAAASQSSKKRLASGLSREATILRRAGLPKDAGAREIQLLLNRNGISTRGALDRNDLVQILDRALPPMTKREESELIYEDPTLLQEREYEFSLANPFNRILACGLGVVNLLGAFYLGNMLSTSALYGVQLPSYFGLVQAGFPLLFGYAVLFNVIPLVRSFWIKVENEKIQKRNRTRRLWKEMLDNNVFAKLGRKLKAAQNMEARMKLLGESQDEIVFDTKQSISEIELAKGKNELDEFDKLLDKEQK